MSNQKYYNFSTTYAELLIPEHVSVVSEDEGGFYGASDNEDSTLLRGQRGQASHQVKTLARG